MLNKPIKPLEDAIAEERRNRDASIASSNEVYTSRCVHAVEQIERNRPVIAMLDAAGFDVRITYWAHGDTFVVQLGHFPNTKRGSKDLADKLRAIREIVGARLGFPPQKELANCNPKGGNVVKFTVEPPTVPGMEIVYTRKLPGGAKCKVVTQRNVYRSIVCEV